MEFVVKYSRPFLYGIIPLVSLALHFHVFPRDLVGFHVWRQTQTQTNIENFYSEDFNILNPRVNDRGDGDGIQRMEFPIMQWLFAGCNRIFGHDVIISRILTFIIGLFTVAGIYRLIGNLFRNTGYAVLGAWAFCFSPVFYYYTLNPMPDNFALCCSVWGMAFFFAYVGRKTFRPALLSAVFLGIATLAKLPYVLYFAPVAAYIIIETFRHRFGNVREIFLLVLVNTIFLIPAVIWYAVAIPRWHGNGVVLGMLQSNEPVSELLNIIRFNLVSSLPELLINYGSVIFFLAGIFYALRNKIFKSTKFLLLGIWGLALIVYFLFEMNMIRYVHDYYLLPFLPAIFLIVYYGIIRLLDSRQKSIRMIAAICLLVLPLTAFLRINHRWSLESPQLNRDLLVYKDELRNTVPNDALCVVGNDESHNIFFYYIDKKGWGFDNDRLDADRLSSMILRGARYLYSDSRVIDKDSTMKDLLGNLILERGSIRVYKLMQPF